MGYSSWLAETTAKEFTTELGLAIPITPTAESIVEGVKSTCIMLEHSVLAAVWPLAKEIKRD
jgi:hypothetical protein